VRCPALFPGEESVMVSAWAGPWPSDVRWWDTHAHARGAHWQLVVETAGGLVACWATSTAARATIDAVYD
jgi:hypothetical protein